MSARIRVLDAALADQIAAGEVVERPASVVKELLENALDAGASTVRLAIEGGGVTRIRVQDDGHGMGPEDAPLSLRRHATSKIARAEDLSAIRTLGFRGEALPSIASVSRLRLKTRREDAVAGTEVTVEGGSPPVVRDVGCATGTVVEVADLFYNVPARRKFLKSVATESAHVSDVVRRAGLAHPRLRVELTRDGRKAIELLPVTTSVERARQVFPREPFSAVEGERSGVRIDAILGPPERARAGAGGLHLFVNQRPVRDRALARAVAFAFGSVLPPGRYPVGAVFVELDPDEVDVNVHPQKAEVRFARGREVYDAVTRLLAVGLGTSAWGGARSAPPPRPAPPEPSGPDPWGRAPPEPAPRAPVNAVLPLDPPLPTPGPGATSGPAGVAAPPPGRGFFSSLRVLGQVRRMLIVCEGADGLHVLDQHAADERVRYDALRRRYRDREVPVQRLLAPVRVELDEAAVALLEERGEELRGLGMEVEMLGPGSAAVRGVPALLRRASPERLLRDVLGELGRRGERAFGDALDMALATMACHGAIRAGDDLSPEECRALLASLDRVEDFGGHCPHGRPVVYSVSFEQLERRLGR
ncbi:MAG: DNA mismatch repair endonuclease MutL [Sandaracinaceae bacterium]